MLFIAPVHRRHHITTDAFDAALKLQLLLKPISYKVPVNLSIMCDIFPHFPLPPTAFDIAQFMFRWIWTS